MLATAIAAAQAAGAVLRRDFGQAVQINDASGHDIKIQADIDTQNLIYSVILRDHPGLKLVGEEGDAGNPRGDVEWIVDPIDGTVNYAVGIPHFCVSIAARKTGTEDILLGVVYDPLRGEMFTAEKDGPARLNGREIRVSSRNKLSDAIMALGFAKSAESVDHCLKLYQHYGHTAKKLRALGSAAIDLAYVAAGRLDAYIEQGVSLWDIAAGKLLVEQAGGKFESERKPDGKYRICASSGRIGFPLK